MSSLKRWQFAFLSIWLTGWSVGVAYIQASVFTEPSLLLLFLFTHGGAEVFVLHYMAKGVYEEVRGGSSLPELVLTHEGMKATWTAGSASRFRGLVTAVLGVVAHGLVIGGALMGLARDPPLLGMALGLGALGIWSWTAWLWVKAVWANLWGVDAVVLEADLDGVELDVAGTAYVFPLSDLRVSIEGEAVRFGDGADAVLVPCVNSLPRKEMVDLLQLMAGKGGEVLDVPVPASLARMQREQG